MYPFKLKAATKDYVWGGIKLKEFYAKEGNGDVIAESWEVSCHPDGPSVIENGQYEGITLAEVLDANPRYKGINSEKFPFFPILVKLIDAKSNLSVQVHPDDEYALSREGQFGKTEMWYIVECEKGAGVYCGFKKPVTKEQLRSFLEDGTVTELLNFVEVKKGDCLFIEAGTVHAICGGCVICEIQQNSSLTYRLYDYGRLDKNGNPRQLHIDKAVDVTDTTKVVSPNAETKVLGNGVTRLAECKYFTTDKVVLDGEHAFEVGEDSFLTVTCVEGSAEFVYNGKKYPVGTGDTYFLPSGMGEVRAEGCAELITARV